MNNIDKLIKELTVANITLDRAPYNTVTSLVTVCQETLQVASKILGTLLTPRALGFNQFQMEFFRKLTEAGGKSVSKSELRSIWGPDDRYTEHIFLNTLQTVRNNLRDKGVMIKGWEPKHWRIIEGLPIAQALLTQIDDTWRAENVLLDEIVTPTTEEPSLVVEMQENEEQEEIEPSDNTPWT